MADRSNASAAARSWSSDDSVEAAGGAGGGVEAGAEVEAEPEVAALSSCALSELQALRATSIVTIPAPETILSMSAHGTYLVTGGRGGTE